VISERGASERLMHAFHALVPDIERRRRLLALAHDEVAESPMIDEETPEELWGRVESMVSSYSDTNYVSEEYGRELWHAQTRVVGVEDAGDDPPERVAGWLNTVNDAALRGLDQQVLTDLLTLEEDANRWRDVAETAAHHAEDLVRVEQFEMAWSLADAVVTHAAAHPERQAHLPKVLSGFASAPIMRQAAQQLRQADDAAVQRFERLCHAIGTRVIAPLAEALSTEQDARSRRRLRDLLVGFGAQGRDAVQQLMHAPNWEVRRTAAFLLREFGGAEGLRELLPLLVDNEPLVQREAVHGLVLNGSDEAGKIVLEALGKVTGRARQTLIAELSSVKDRRASPVLAYLVRHLNRAKHPQVYLAAIESLGTFGDPAAVDALKAALYAGEWWSPVRTRTARTAAAASLRRIGTPAAVDALKAASQSGGRGTRAAARAELTQLGQTGS
jgi:HEAT repeat protein